MEKRLLTIQDISCVGQCSATVALPVISACGIECAVLPAAVLSNHTGGFDSWSFLDLTAEMPRIAEYWRKQDIAFDAFYTGYVCPVQIAPIREIFETCARPGALRFVDPVMADNGKMYPGFDASFPAQMAELCKGADYLMPNLTEAAFLLGETPVLSGYDRAYIEKTVRALHGIGARNVILTGVSFAEDELGTAISDGTSVRYDFNPRFARTCHGTGDVFASVFAGAVMRGASPFDAAALAADVVCRALEATPPEHWYGVAFEKTIPFLVSRLEACAGA